MTKNDFALESIKRIDDLLGDLASIELKIKTMPCVTGWDVKTGMVVSDIKEIEQKLIKNRTDASNNLYTIK